MKRSFIQPVKPFGKETSDVRTLISLPMVWGNCIVLSLVFAVFPAVGVTLQVWIGVEPLAKSPVEISLVSVITTVSAIVPAVTLAPLLVRRIGPVFTMWLGFGPLLLGVALIGNYPTFFPFVSPSMGQVYASMLLMSVAISVVSPAGIVVFQLAIKHAGLDPQGSAAPLSLVVLVVPTISAVVGPLAMGPAASAIGVSLAGTILFGLAAAALCTSLVLHWPLAGVLPPEPDVPEADGAAEGDGAKKDASS